MRLRLNIAEILLSYNTFTFQTHVLGEFIICPMDTTFANFLTCSEIIMDFLLERDNWGSVFLPNLTCCLELVYEGNRLEKEEEKSQCVQTTRARRYFVCLLLNKMFINQSIQPAVILDSLSFINDFIQVEHQTRIFQILSVQPMCIITNMSTSHDTTVAVIFYVDQLS